MQRTGTHLKIAAAAALALALLAPFAAHAQSGKSDEHSGHHPPGAAPAPATPSAPGPAPRMGMMGGQPGMTPMMHAMMARMNSVAGMPHMMVHHPEGYLAFLKAELQITTEQALLWSTFADAARLAVKKLREKPPAPPGGASAWPDRLADTERTLMMQLGALKTFRPAAAALYAVLTPAQRKTADALTSGAMDMRM